MAAVLEAVIEADPMNEPSAKQLEIDLTAGKDTDSGHWSSNTQTHNEDIDDDIRSSIDEEESDIQTFANCLTADIVKSALAYNNKLCLS